MIHPDTSWPLRWCFFGQAMAGIEAPHFVPVPEIPKLPMTPQVDAFGATLGSQVGWWRVVSEMIYVYSWWVNLAQGTESYWSFWFQYT